MKILKILGSLEITRILLITLAVLSVFGTLIPQDKAEDFYNSVIYSVMLLLLGINLFICTVNTFQWKIFKSSRKTALFLLHTSIFLIFAGAVIGKNMRYSKHYRLLPGETINFNGSQSQLVFDEFNIDFYPHTGQPAEYWSKVSFFEGKDKKKDIIIRVNHPASFKGYSYYQSGFDAVADADVTVSHMGEQLWQGRVFSEKLITVPGEINFELKILKFYPDVFVNENREILEKSYKPGKAAFLIAFLKNEQIIDTYRVFKDKAMNDQFKGKGRMFEFEIGDFDTRYATILQVVKDPGLKLVLTGFFCLLLGMVVFLFQKNER